MNSGQATPLARKHRAQHVGAAAAGASGEAGVDIKVVPVLVLPQAGGEPGGLAVVGHAGVLRHGGDVDTEAL